MLGRVAIKVRFLLMPLVRQLARHTALTSEAPTARYNMRAHLALSERDAAVPATRGNNKSAP